MDKKYTQNPKLIEKKSFEIINTEIMKLKSGYKFENRYQEHIIKRVIHTTADFSYLDTLTMTDDFIDVITALLNGKSLIFTDTNMALSGISKRNLDKLGVKYNCLIADEHVAEYAKKNGITRSMAAVDMELKQKGDKIFVIGNAPTALFRLLEHYDNGYKDIKCIVGMPVGFVGAMESKVELHKYKIAHITSISRKGGSNVAASIINAVTYEMLK